MKILSFGDLKSGCWKARIERPLEGLKKLGHEVFYSNDENIQIKGKDIVIFNNLFNLDGETIPNFIKRVHKAGGKVVYDTDDAIDLIEYHNYNAEKASAVMYSFYEMLEYADLVTTTTKELASYLVTKTDKPVRVMPNCLDPKDFPERKQFKKPRIGFVGSTSHAKDIMLILPEIERLQKKYDFDFVIMGFSKHDLNGFVKECKGTRMEYYAEDIKKGLRRIKHEWIPWQDVQDYPKMLADLGLDIGLCPLEDSEFNHYKSAIKFYEYALVGTCALASDVLPYSKEPVLKANNWHDALEILLKEKEFRQLEAEGQKKWVQENRDSEKIALEYEKLFKSLIENKC